MGIQPLQDWVLIEPSEAKEKTAGGMFIPDTAKEKRVEGKVLAVGKGRWEIPEKKWGSKPKGKEEKVFKPTVLKPGDQVLYEKYGTTQSIWTVRNSFSSASPTSWAGTTNVRVRSCNATWLRNKSPSSPPAARPESLLSFSVSFRIRSLR